MCMAEVLVGECWEGKERVLGEGKGSDEGVRGKLCMEEGSGVGF